MIPLYKRLADAGLQKAYVRAHGLPDWWEDGYAAEAGTFHEAKLTLSRRLGLELGRLLDDDQLIRFRDIGNCRFKAKSKKGVCRLVPAQSLARTLAEMAAVAVATP